MRLLITEFITGGGMANDLLPESLKQEGQLMLQAVLDDCLKISELELVTTLDARIAFDMDDVRGYVIEKASDYLQQLVLIAQQCDATWVIAPESDGILEKILSHLSDEKITLINCSAESVKLTGDKFDCAEHLQKNNILTLPNLSQDQVLDIKYPVMIKDRYGVGCEGLMRCENGLDAMQHIEDYSQWVVQPYLKGEHLSISTLFTKQRAYVLSVNEQVFFHEYQNIKLMACNVNARPVDGKISRLVEKIYHAFPGLLAYVGIDMIYANNEYYIIDINPRLTSSYVGLCHVLANNPADLCIKSVLDTEYSPVLTFIDQVVEVTVG